LLTFATWPKPFEGLTATRQRAAVRSWKRLGPSQVLLFGDADGVSEAAMDLGVEHIPQVARNGYGTALLDDLLATTRSVAQSPLICLANSDVVIGDDLLRAADLLASQGSFLLIGRCADVDEAYADEPVADLLERGRSAGLRDAGALDFFVFPRDLYEDVPAFALGRAGFDNWLVWRARDLGVPVVDGTGAVRPVHLRHEYNHVPGGRAWSYTGAEARRNVELAGGWLHLYNVDDASHRLLPDGLHRNWRAIVRTLPVARRARLWLSARRAGKATEDTLSP
jgi:hypothetical protein